MVGGAATELLARVLPRRDGEDLPDLRDRLARAALRNPTGPTLVADDGEASIAIWLERLPVADRVLITLRYGERLRIAEVARVLDQPATTIESRLSDLAAEVPPPAEAYLAFGLDRLADGAPTPAQLRRAVTVRSERTARRGRDTAGLLGLALVLLITAGTVTAQVTPWPRDDGWQLLLRVDPPPGWTVTRTAASRSAEATWLRRGPEECLVSLATNSGPDFVRPIDRGRDLPEREVVVGQDVGHVMGDARLTWSSGEHGASLECDRSGDIGRLIAIAESVRFETRPLRIPVGLPEPPSGAQEPVVVLMPGDTPWLTARRIYFSAAFTVPAPSAADSPCDRPGPPPPSTPSGEPAPADARVERRHARAPTGEVCVEVTWFGAPSAAQRGLLEQQLTELIGHLVIAPDPADPPTWFDAGDVLPPRHPR